MDLRRLRKAARISQTELSLASGVPRWRISAAESRYITLRGSERVAIEDALAREVQRRKSELHNALAGGREQDRVAVAI